MIQSVRVVSDHAAITAWLERTVRPVLTPDVSNYATGRLRADGRPPGSFPPHCEAVDPPLLSD